MISLRYDSNLRAFVNEDEERLKREHADAILRERSKRIDAKWVEALREEERNRLRAIAGQPSEAERIIQQMKEMRR